MTRAETLINYLERGDVNISTKKKFIVHVLGADYREGQSGAETVAIFRPLALYLATKTPVSSLELVLVGPNVARRLHLVQFSQSVSNDKEATCNVTIVYFVGNFEVYYEDKALYCEPDVVVCFNAGVWGYDEWRPALQLVLNHLCSPLLITSYNEQEAADDEDVLDKLALVKWLWRPEKNKCGAKTARATQQKGVILKENDYWMCLRGAQT